MLFPRLDDLFDPADADVVLAVWSLPLFRPRPRRLDQGGPVWKRR